jgi:hypothetical protein
MRKGNGKEHDIMATTIKVKVQPLNPDAFRPYGQVLESRHTLSTRK